MARRYNLNKEKGVAILGSTGSIGVNTLDVVRANKGAFRVVSLAAGRNIALLKKQIAEFRPRFVSVTDEKDAEVLSKDKKLNSVCAFDVGFGVSGASIAASYKGVDITVSAIVGSAGLIPTLAAIKAGKDIALANKETLVAAGELVMQEVRRCGVTLIPVDSEHSAVFQSLKGHDSKEVKKIILTASGGPFLDYPVSKLKDVTPERALKHPTWDMGRRITIDSATMMNKGFEVIEAHWLFDVSGDKIDVCVHPQSIVHSMVEYVDGSIVAQLGSSDMRLPIAYALGYPKRVAINGAKKFSFDGKRLEFRDVEEKKYPCLELAYKAMDMGGTAGAVLNAADEVAVEMFLKKKIRFTGIYECINAVLRSHKPIAARTINDVLEADFWARKKALSIINKGKL